VDGFPAKAMDPAALHVQHPSSSPHLHRGVLTHMLLNRAAEGSMLGPAKPRRPNPSVVVSLEALAPPKSCNRHFIATVDLDFSRDWAWER